MDDTRTPDEGLSQAGGAPQPPVIPAPKRRPSAGEGQPEAAPSLGEEQSEPGDPTILVVPTVLPQPEPPQPAEEMPAAVEEPSLWDAVQAAVEEQEAEPEAAEAMPTVAEPEAAEPEAAPVVAEAAPATEEAEASLDEMVAGLRDEAAQATDAETPAAESGAGEEGAPAEAAPEGEAAAPAEEAAPAEAAAPLVMAEPEEDTRALRRKSAKLPFWIYTGAWVVFAGVQTYLMWPLAKTRFVEQPIYGLLVLIATALVCIGPILGLSVWWYVSAHSEPSERDGLVRAMLLRSALAMTAGVVIWWIALLALDFARAGMLG